jgi:hypothetical protein
MWSRKRRICPGRIINIKTGDGSLGTLPWPESRLFCNEFKEPAPVFLFSA